MDNEVEGVIKYEQHLSPWDTVAQFSNYIEQLNLIRAPLYQQKLVGIDAQGFGYGNISMRTEHNQFIITSSQTGHIQNLTSNDYTYVYQADLALQKLWAHGVKQASSESLTHYTIYTLNNEISHVVHIHNFNIWDHLMNSPACKQTDPHVEYGTFEMAEQMKQLYTHVNDRFVLAGHQDGVIYLANSKKKILELIDADYKVVFK